MPIRAGIALAVLNAIFKPGNEAAEAFDMRPLIDDHLVEIFNHLLLISHPHFQRVEA